jgi:hypothetical protein
MKRATFSLNAHKATRGLWAPAAFTLAFSAAPLLHAQNYAGAVESATCAAVTGWAWDSTQPNSPLNVDLYDSTTPIATVTANVYRADLYAAGYGNGYHGFSFTVPPNLKDGNTHYIYGYISGTQVGLTGNGSYAVSCPANSVGYQPYYTDALTSINSSNWTQNGSVSARQCRANRYLERRRIADLDCVSSRRERGLRGEEHVDARRERRNVRELRSRQQRSNDGTVRGRHFLFA